MENQPQYPQSDDPVPTEQDEDLTPLDSYHQHEVVHTASIQAACWESFVQDHRWTAAHPELLDAAVAATDAMHTFYQMAAQYPLAADPAPAAGED